MMRHGLRTILFAAFLAMAVCASGPAAAADPMPVPAEGPADAVLAVRGELPPWQRALYKTITFQAVANATDVLMFDLVVGAHPVLLGGFFVANAATAAGLYYGFEYLWQQNGPTIENTTEMTLVKKSLVFQAVNSGRIFVLGYGLGATALAASTLAGAVFLTDTGVYFANEYVWDILRPIASDTPGAPLTPSSVPVSGGQVVSLRP